MAKFILRGSTRDEQLSANVFEGRLVSFFRSANFNQKDRSRLMRLNADEIKRHPASENIRRVYRENSSG